MNTVIQKNNPLNISRNADSHLIKESTRVELEHSTNTKLCIPTLQGNHYIPFLNILYCRANGSYAILHDNKHNQMLVSKVLKWIDNRLPTTQFIRVHHSFIVNKNSISHFHFSTQSWLTLTDGTIIPVARSRKRYVKSQLAY